MNNDDTNQLSSDNDKTVTATAENPTIIQSIGANGVLLGIFALISTAIIAGTQLVTADKIAEQKRQAQLKALYQIIPRDRHDNDLLTHNISLQDIQLGLRKEKPLFLATKDQQLVALIYSATARDGYSGDIDFIVGININDSSIAGVRVLSHKETPGLGDKVDLRKSDWILGFDGRSLGNPDFSQWTVKKDGGEFDGFTGATITPRAVTQSIASVLKYHHQNQAQLIKRFATQQDDSQASSKPVLSRPELSRPELSSSELINPR